MLHVGVLQDAFARFQNGNLCNPAAAQGCLGLRGFMQGFIIEIVYGSRWGAIWVQSSLALNVSHIGWQSAQLDLNWHKFEIFAIC